MFPFCQQDFGHNNAIWTVNTRVKLNQTFYLRFLPHLLHKAGPRHKNIQKTKPSHLSKLPGQLSNTGATTTGQSQNAAFTLFMIPLL